MQIFEFHGRGGSPKCLFQWSVFVSLVVADGLSWEGTLSLFSRVCSRGVLMVDVIMSKLFDSWPGGGPGGGIYVGGESFE